MSRVFYLGAPPEARLPPNPSVSDVMRATGNNTGNLLIGNAIRRHLAPTTFCADWALDRDFAKTGAGYVNDNFDRVVIGASNFLFHGSDKTWMANFLEAVKLPVVMIGLGAQAPDYDDDVTVPEGTVRLVRLVSERSKTLGVRGEFTATVLNRLGIKNVSVIGCPSMFWTCEPTLRLNRQPDDRPLAVVVNGSANVTAHSVDPEAAAKVEMMIAGLSFERGYPYVLQNETELMDIVENDSADDPALIEALMRRYDLSNLSPEAFIHFVRRNMRFYSDVDEWRRALEHSSLVIGTRFHGCLIGLLAGVPSFTFSHDARTRELCEVLQMPHMNVRRVESIDVDSLYDSLDLGAVEATYRRAFSRYVNFLDDNGLEHGLER